MELLEAVEACGVVGAGGAGFPTHIKLKAQSEYFLVNAAECEPLIETDKYLCRSQAQRLVDTVGKIAAHLNADKPVIVLKDHYHEEIKAVEEAIKELNSNVTIFKIRTFYPAGDEQSLVEQVTRRSVPERGLPLDVGCVVSNVGTVLSVADALEGKPVDWKYLSVTGDVNEIKMFHVPVGTPVLKILEKVNIRPKDYSVIMGGPMMGKMLSDKKAIEEAVVTKTTGNLLVIPSDHYLVRRSNLPLRTMIRQAASVCIQCRMCTDLCPRYLIGHDVFPNKVMRNVWREENITDNDSYLEIFGSAANCCSCGACEMFSCPMGLSPRRMNEYIKGKLRQRGIDVPKNTSPQARSGVDIHKIPTERLIARLGLSEYDTHKSPNDLIEFEPEECIIPLSQHIGKPASAVVSKGDSVNKGDLVAKAAEGLSANIHCGIDGLVTDVTDTKIVISKRGDNL
ncbi:Na+-translocating ferredoxin:NAD+ oxidoreductase RNF, RnfC subunit [Acetitomaculum ruminis DSM 5522]|uniref:Na+-translocating ferredoxin:NAD+ oxidoreductase RNF, RnfC subunit n=1 Tax=Acetitomaculum ruminis DSM 5522 TaxID=1120918 RepID=A0A1I0ZSR2_9FIRM|nr:4Fe-4S dicluster domain-containing protein [Acetitomaculum ruminis]SFB28829.1 Na+-translocating ferredoxin:NAD+ oxidoreductase RNF, RnfC subunit [Acetitomaculum ruminis DSM 5522]